MGATGINKYNNYNNYQTNNQWGLNVNPVFRSNQQYTKTESAIAAINHNVAPTLTAGDSYYTINPDSSKRHSNTTLMFMA